jgi:hypothetical protein
MSEERWDAPHSVASTALDPALQALGGWILRAAMPIIDPPRPYYKQAYIKVRYQFCDTTRDAALE